MNNGIYQAGQRLRQIREEHGLTLKDVEEQSQRIAGSDSGGKWPMGRGLREIREKLGLTLDDVEKGSRQIVETRQIPEYLFTAGRLCQVEQSNSLPSIYKFASLSVIYQTPFAELLRIYGIETAWVRQRRK